MSADCNDGQRDAIIDEYDYVDWIYAMLEKLTTVAECAQAKSKKQKDHIHQFAL